MARAATLLMLLAPTAYAGKWVTYRDAKLLGNEYLDGDSFHVKCGRAHYIFRLYFVDAPETDLSFKDRVVEQAEYWGVEEDDLLELGREAADFTRRFLESGFTVHTRKADARGRSDRKRYFAIIQVGDRTLAEALVEAGLARVHGRGTDLPDGRRARKHWAELRRLQGRAKKSGTGAWERRSQGRTSVPEVDPHTRTVHRSVTVYDARESWRRIGYLRPGTEVRVLRAETAFMALIEFEAGDRRLQGLSRMTDLGIR